MPIITTKVLNYNENLKGIVKINNKEIALDGVIKDEVIELDASKDLNYITLKKIIEPSKKRVTPPCPIYNKCGGCTLLHMDYKEQLKIKTELVENLFFNEFKRFYKVNDTLGMVNPSHYRNKNQIVFQNVKGGKCRLASGFYQENSHKIVDFTTCYIQDETSDKIVQTIKELMLKMHYNAYDEDHKNGLIRHVLIKRSDTTKEIMVVIVTSSEVFPGCQNFVKALVARHKDITTIIQNVNSRSTSAVLGDKEKILFGKGYINDILLDKKFKISSKSFYQVNSKQCAVLYTKALEMASLSKNDTLLDAYCGVGTIGLIASSKVGKVIGVELEASAVDDAILNAKVNNVKNIHFFKADASIFLKNLTNKKEKIDVIVMDPPRKGSDLKFLNSVLKLKPKKIIYISCDPRTQVVDLKTLTTDGYTIEQIQPVDMFPHTQHVENIVLLERK